MDVETSEAIERPGGQIDALDVSLRTSSPERRTWWCDTILDEHSVREGGPYADSLIIRFGSSACHGLVDICERAIEGEADGRVDHGDDIRVWWD